MMSEVEVHPVQMPSAVSVRREGAKCPKVVTLAAYEVYSKVFSPQEALITGRCRGGFGAGELIALLYARSFPQNEWRERFGEALRGMIEPVRYKDASAAVKVWRWIRYGPEIPLRFAWDCFRWLIAGWPPIITQAPLEPNTEEQRDSYERQIAKLEAQLRQANEQIEDLTKDRFAANERAANMADTVLAIYKRLGLNEGNVPATELVSDTVLRHIDQKDTQLAVMREASFDLVDKLDTWLCAVKGQYPDYDDGSWNLDYALEQSVSVGEVMEFKQAMERLQKALSSDAGRESTSKEQVLDEATIRLATRETAKVYAERDRLRERCEEIADQPLSTDMKYPDNVDYERGYDEIILTVRAALGSDEL